MKKLFALVVFLSLVLSFSACGNKNGSEVSGADQVSDTYSEMSVQESSADSSSQTEPGLSSGQSAQISSNGSHSSQITGDVSASTPVKDKSSENESSNSYENTSGEKQETEFPVADISLPQNGGSSVPKTGVETNIGAELFD